MAPFPTGLALLEDAGLEPPEGFDGERLLADIAEAGDTYRLLHIVERPRMNFEESRTVQKVGSTAQKLVNCINEVLALDATSFVPDELSDRLQLLDGISLFSGEARPETASTARLVELRDEVSRLVEACEMARRTPLAQGEHGEKIWDAWGELIARRLPAVFSRHFRKKCGFSADPATEGVRFIASALVHLGLGGRSAEAIVKERSKWRAWRSQVEKPHEE
ncbi:hypothetical protein M0638_28330 [Roseomonas sp. NAR14]|uniref:Uncharacterized protein n=1 Tax=Roseomonas acroporae TaxID=2937791 RepID=A0A9X2BWY2_9PROT|nr:hypothetical protein [Roseomonas acroporae]MCK8788263.1 hypothetical protein [Roseomonas acroporae]